MYISKNKTKSDFDEKKKYIYIYIYLKFNLFISTKIIDNFNEMRKWGNEVRRVSTRASWVGLRVNLSQTQT